MVKDWVTEAALYVAFPVLYAGADAVIVHKPTPVVLPLVMHGPDAVKLTVCPGGEDDALNENVLPYCTFGNCGKTIDCD
jgi:hypothetical protein